MKEQKIKQDAHICIGENIRRIRLERGMQMNELAQEVQLRGIYMVREALVKIEGGRQHVTASQLECFKDVLQTTYDELLRPRQ